MLKPTNDVHPVFEGLGVDHQRFSQVLDVLERTTSSEDPDWSLIRDCLRYLSEYADAVHHKLEDVVFDNLLKAPLTDAQRESVVVNAKQHKTLGEASARLSQDVDMVLRDVVVPADQIRLHLDQYLKAQRDHIRYENEYVFPLAQEHITAQAWDDVSQDLTQIQDPVFQSRVNEYHRLYQFVQELAEERDD